LCTKRSLEAIRLFEKILEKDPENEIVKKYKYRAFDTIPISLIENSKYLGHALIKVKNFDGMLVSVVNLKLSHYRPHPIVDEYLQLFPVKEVIVIDEKKFEKREIVIVKDYSQEIQVYGYGYGSHIMLNEPRYFSEPFLIFAGLSHAYAFEGGDTVTVVWTVLKSID